MSISEAIRPSLGSSQIWAERCLCPSLWFRHLPCSRLLCIYHNYFASLFFACKARVFRVHVCAWEHSQAFNEWAMFNLHTTSLVFNLTTILWLHCMKKPSLRYLHYVNGKNVDCQHSSSTTLTYCIPAVPSLLHLCGCVLSWCLFLEGGGGSCAIKLCTWVEAWYQILYVAQCCTFILHSIFYVVIIVIKHRHLQAFVYDTVVL